jgi:hypothetical protein
VTLASIAAGGSYWPTYLLQLAPATVLGTALAARASGRQRNLERVCVPAASSAAVAPDRRRANRAR